MSENTIDDNGEPSAIDGLKAGLSHLLTGRSNENTPVIAKDTRATIKGFGEFAITLGLIGLFLIFITKALS